MIPADERAPADASGQGAPGESPMYLIHDSSLDPSSLGESAAARLSPVTWAANVTFLILGFAPFKCASTGIYSTTNTISARDSARPISL